eukprot:GHVL01000119.1.p1 GENE.GHVL01000119.1~~GHVL01000119.1.p1  ORF type:complete len:523 (+),score=69.82 GHVL01000119.1:41-1609(+)
MEDEGESPKDMMTEHADLLKSATLKFSTKEKYSIKCKDALVSNMEEYSQLYRQSIDNSDEFWNIMALKHLRWMSPYNKVSEGSFEEIFTAYFLNGKLNVCDNCVDRWAEESPNKIAVIWEGDEPNHIEKITYSKLRGEICKTANLLKTLGVRKYDPVVIYMPMIPEVIYCILACARIGAVHSVVFAGFSAANLKQRIVDIKSKIILTADQGVRGGRIIPTKITVDEALQGCEFVEKCVVFRHPTNPSDHIHWRNIDVDGTKLKNDERPYCPLEPMDSEDLLFILYTSGSTGKPKGLGHSSAGYLLYCCLTFKYVFDYKPNDVFACMADVGWITGHSYMLYGSLCSGATTLLFESIPTYPDSGRYWSMVERHRITQLYIAPTAIRTLMRHSTDLKKYDKTSLRVLGTVGEPINADAWRWYFKEIGEERCSIVDTYWQTETGGHVITSLPGAFDMKPGASGLPFFGIEPLILDVASGNILEGNNVAGVLCIKHKWPGFCRSVHGDHTRLFKNYIMPYPHHYFTE